MPVEYVPLVVLILLAAVFAVIALVVPAVSGHTAPPRPAWSRMSWACCLTPMPAAVFRPVLRHRRPLYPL